MTLGRADSTPAANSPLVKMLPKLRRAFQETLLQHDVPRLGQLKEIILTTALVPLGSSSLLGGSSSHLGGSLLGSTTAAGAAGNSTCCCCSLCTCMSRQVFGSCSTS